MLPLELNAREFGVAGKSTCDPTTFMGVLIGKMVLKQPSIVPQPLLVTHTFSVGAVVAWLVATTTFRE